MNKKTLFASVIAALVIMPSFAEVPTTNGKITTSKTYVDTQVGTRQAKIPAAGINVATPGASVVMYTGTEGTIGERQIFNGGTYTEGTDANKLVTASALNNSVTNIPTMTTSKLTCVDSPDCTLWSIDDQTVYGEDD